MNRLVFVGTKEAAELLGWKSYQQVQRYNKDRIAGFPEPYQVLKTGPIWLRDDIVKWGDCRTAPKIEAVTRAYAELYDKALDHLVSLGAFQVPNPAVAKAIALRRLMDSGYEESAAMRAIDQAMGGEEWV